jgi:hypothetical protein
MDLDEPLLGAAQIAALADTDIVNIPREDARRAA